MLVRTTAILILLLALVAPVVLVRAQSGSASRADLLKATEEYKSSLEKLVNLYEKDLERVTDLAEKRKKLYDQGIISRKDYEEGERAIVETRAKLDETQKRIAEADILVAEAKAVEEELDSLEKSQTRQRGYSVSSSLIRYTGSSSFALKDTARLESFFSNRFGRSLPISAFGQTTVHDRLGFNHHNAVDIAVHPDSAEGQALMFYLRNAGIPFLAFRNAMPGAATGAHIHIGRPSARL
jgi:hypothetical protein